jgi:site-specific DNA-methyltransferase (adenine-specific)
MNPPYTAPLSGHNPDILTCLANLSADEVFTPPKLAEAMLDMLPQDLFRSPETRFLDPFCKTGVFLREIAKRLNEGLRDQMPDEQLRVDHILKYQVFGMATSELTAIISRRSVYCSKKANGKYSISTAFDSFEGNIRLPIAKHRWSKNGRCMDCGAVAAELERGEIHEAYAYPFIHNIDPSEIFKMNFDVIIGNPPYQLNDGGHGRSASPIYHQFVQQAKKLQPKFLTMVIPSRWFAGGKGLDEFRKEMLSDRQIKILVDYPDSAEIFPGVDLSGGICYFLWEKNHSGACTVKSVIGNSSSELRRHLLEDEMEVFIRYNEAVPILEKVRQHKEPKFSELVSSRKPFGLGTTTVGKSKEFENAVTLYGSTGTTYIDRNLISVNSQWIDKFKVFVGRAYGERISSSYWVTGKPFIGKPGVACSETYLVVGPFSDQTTCENVMSYMRTRFFRFLVLLVKNTQDAPSRVYQLAPLQDFTKAWTDEELFAKYGLDSNEISFIESMVRPMMSND